MNETKGIVEVARDGSMTVWTENGRPVYLSKLQAQAVHEAYAQECDGCACFQGGHEYCAENNHGY